MMQAYLDFGATTPVDPEIIKSMNPYFTNHFGNSSSIHAYGLKAKEAVETSREQVAKCINAEPEEIIFTSGGTESDNHGIKGVAFKYLNQINKNPKHIITCEIEHPAVLETCKYLEKIGFKVTYVPVDKYGLIDPKDIKNAITDETILISIMYANNEIGTIEPIEEIGKIAEKNNVTLHTDAVQAIGKIKVDVKKQNVDLISLSSHKIYGPKGIGAIYIKKGLKIIPILHGGGHEKGLRSSTLNTPGIVGFGKACELAKARLESDNKHLINLRDRLIKNLLKIEKSYLNGHPTKRLPNNAHFRFSAIEGESLHMMLDAKGIAAATGSACSSKKLRPSHVLLATGLEPEESHGSIRFSLGRTTTKEQIDYVSKELPIIVNSLRKMSPLWNK
jgi:cysteine desulfurase